MRSASPFRCYCYFSDMLRAHALLGNSQRLDGGAMFGNAPRALWGRWCPPDELGRIHLACRALLVEEEKRRILFETGVGAFFEPKLRARYGVVEGRHVLLDSLGALGLTSEDIDVVVLSHLHFDHAGGLLAPWQEGREPELLFPRATFVVGRTAYERAVRPHLRDRASFIDPLPELLAQSGRLRLVDGPEGAREVLGPRYELVETSGHTPGMLHATVGGAHHRLFFCADLVPGTPWIHVPITMGYDRFPEQLVDEKRRVFDTLLQQDAWLFFTHDPKVAAARLTRDVEGRYRPVDETPSFGFGWDLDDPDSPRPA